VRGNIVNLLSIDPDIAWRGFQVVDKLLSASNAHTFVPFHVFIGWPLLSSGHVLRDLVYSLCQAGCAVMIPIPVSHSSMTS